MQIKFLNIYDYYTEISQVQYELLEFWQNAIMHDQINFINFAKIEFKNYSFADYPDQKKLRCELHKSTVSGYDTVIESDFWFANRKCYTNFEDLYIDLAKDHRLMELTITVEEK